MKKIKGFFAQRSLFKNLRFTPLKVLIYAVEFRVLTGVAFSSCATRIIQNYFLDQIVRKIVIVPFVQSHHSILLQQSKVLEDPLEGRAGAYIFAHLNI